MVGLEYWVRRKNILSGLIAIAIISTIALGCTCSDDVTDETDRSKTEDNVPKAFWGEWTGEDGSSLAIRADGSGDYESSGLKVTGGSVTIDSSAQTLNISFMLVGKTLKIDKAPVNNRMVLDGVEFTRRGASDTSPATVPPQEQLQSLARKTILDFNRAIQTKDFGEFHNTLCRPFQKETSPEKLADVFKDFMKGGFHFNTESDANFTDPPAVVESEGFDVLQLKGYYPTTPRRVRFEFKYLFEEGAWKLFSLRINTKD